jgi:flagellin-specific chaperone FliS
VVPTDAGVASVDRVVILLYSEALSLLCRARRAPDGCLREVHAVAAILVELSNALIEREDREEVVDLVSLYRYMIYRLTSAGPCASDEALAEVERLFVTLMDGWIQVLPAGPDSGFPSSLEPDDPRSVPASFPTHTSPAED